MDRKKLKERIARDEINAIEKALNEGKKRGRKPRIDAELKNKSDEALFEAGLAIAGLRAESLAKATKQAQENNRNAIRIIEEEVGGKEKLVRLAVKYLYNAITEEC